MMKGDYNTIIGINLWQNPYWDEEDKTMGMVHHGEHRLCMKFIN